MNGRLASTPTGVKVCEPVLVTVPPPETVLVEAAAFVPVLVEEPPPLTLEAVMPAFRPEEEQLPPPVFRLVVSAPLRALDETVPPEATALVVVAPLRALAVTRPPPETDEDPETALKPEDVTLPPPETLEAADLAGGPVAAAGIRSGSNHSSGVVPPNQSRRSGSKSPGIYASRLIVPKDPTSIVTAEAATSDLKRGMSVPAFAPFSMTAQMRAT